MMAFTMASSGESPLSEASSSAGSTWSSLSRKSRSITLGLLAAELPSASFLAEAASLSFLLAVHFISSNCGMARMTSSLPAPRSVSRVVMLVKKCSAAVGWRSRASSWFFRCFLTLETWGRRWRKRASRRQGVKAGDL